MPPLPVLHYAGSEPLTGHYRRDAFAENVHMGGFFDRRDIEDFAEALETGLRTHACSRDCDDKAGADVADRFIVPAPE